MFFLPISPCALSLTASLDSDPVNSILGNTEEAAWGKQSVCVLWPSGWSEVLKLSRASEIAGGLVQIQIAGPTPRFLDLTGLLRAWDFVLLMGSLGLLMWLVWHPAWRAPGLDALSGQARRSSWLGTWGQLGCQQVLCSLASCPIPGISQGSRRRSQEDPLWVYFGLSSNCPSAWSLLLFIFQKCSKLLGHLSTVVVGILFCCYFGVVLERKEVNMWALSTAMKYKFMYYSETSDK